VLWNLLKTSKLVLGDPSRWSDKNDFAAIEAYLKEQRIKKIFAVCFNLESETMFYWKTYADGESGCCIEFEKQSLLDSIERAPENENRHVIHRPVEYWAIRCVGTHLADIPTCRLPFTKRLPYWPEAEYRILGEGKKNEEKIELKICLNSIKKITLSQLMPKGRYILTEIRLRRIIKNKGMDTEVNQSTIYWNEDWIDAFHKRADATCSIEQHI
jgi:hypothetical protein